MKLTQEEKGKVKPILHLLPFRDREIVSLRNGIGTGFTYTLEEVGRIFKMTRERVRQVEAKAVKALRSLLREKAVRGLVNYIAEKYHGPHQEPWGSCSDGVCQRAHEAAREI